MKQLDGKAAQAVNLDGQEDNPVVIRGELTVKLIRPKRRSDE